MAEIRSSTEDRVAPPLVVDDPSRFAWDNEADVIVVGFGGAGLSAAIQARESGAGVIAIDRFAGGGATRYSGGVYYAGGGTKYQREGGVNDTPEEMFKYLRAEGTPLTDATLRRLCERSVADFEWIEAHGVPFAGNPYFKKTAYPPHPHYLYYSGNEATPAFMDKSRPAPRGHRPMVSGFGGYLYYEKLSAVASRLGVRFFPHTPARRLILDRDRQVIGIEVNAIPEELWNKRDELYAKVSPMKPLNAKRAQRAIDACNAMEAAVSAPKRFRARAGVILATGGFVNNVDMLRKYRRVLGDNYLGIQRLGSMGCDGSGIAMGQSVGGATQLMERMFLARMIAPPEAFLGGVIVNSTGQRFVNEDAYTSIVGNAIAEQDQSGMAWLILDATHFWQAIKQSLFPGKNVFLIYGAPALMNIFLGGTKRGTSLRALAKKCGVDPAGLESTIAAFNANTGDGAIDPLGKSPDKLKLIRGSSYYAVNVSISNKFAPAWVFTLGGLEVEQETGLVRNVDGRPIRGLYAAGRTAVGLCSMAYNMSGSSIADTVFSGRRAAVHAVSGMNSTKAPATGTEP